MARPLPPKGDPDTLYLVDLSSYVFRAYHAIAPLSSPSGEPTHATYGTVNMLRRMLTAQAPRLVAVAMDSKTKTFRHEIDPNYKANRPPPPEDLSLQMSRSREIVEALGIPVWQQDGFEADDIIASAVRLATEQGLRVVIVSADKDLMQLISDNVWMWDTMRNRVYDSEAVRAKFGVHPSQLGDFLALVGDNSDNIKGVPRVGVKTASKLLNEYGDLETLLGAAEEMKPGWLRNNLLEHADTARLARRLVSLRNDLELTLDLEALDYQRHVDSDRLLQLFQELGFTRMADELLAAKKETDQDAPGPDQPAVHYQTVRTEQALQQAVQACRKAGRFAIDTETTGTDSMRDHLVGISLSWAQGRACYIPCGHQTLPAEDQLPLETVRKHIEPLLTDPSLKRYGHNCKFDFKVLAQHGFSWPASIDGDTMIASYLLEPEGSHGLKRLAQERLGITMETFDEVTDQKKNKGQTIDHIPADRVRDYACADADISLRLHDMLSNRLEQEHLIELYRSMEMPLVGVLADMERTGVLLDREKLLRLQRDFAERIATLEKQAQEQAGETFNPNSPRQLERILFDKLGLRVVKRTKTGRSTDASVLEALEGEHPLVDTILRLRQLTKLKGTYVDTLPRLVHPKTGRVHTKFNQTVAATGRLSSSDPNLQNIPVRTPEGKAIREAFVAAPGYVLVSADYSQIELRVLAHLAEDPALIEAFRTGQDVHARAAAEIFGVDVEQVTPEMRRQAKTIQFGVIYGMGEVSLSKRLKIPRKEAKQLIEAYFARYESVKEFMKRTKEQAKEQGKVTTMFGRIRPLPDIDSRNPRLRAQAERIAGNTPIQGTAADLLKLAMLALAKGPTPGARMILTVHDELVFEVPEDQQQQAVEVIRSKMEGVAELKVPLVVDIGVGKDWAQAH